MSEDVPFGVSSDEEMQEGDEDVFRNRGRVVASVGTSRPETAVEDLTQKHGLTGNFAKMWAAQKEMTDSALKQELKPIKQAINVQSKKLHQGRTGAAGAREAAEGFD
ncbi:unnamed protein product [Prorocentrum cordatum]|uniref:Uncharacterized protein n=1 Tax=Prorocentrum cordatum TaxID=2364126 RepID=A0ABN9UN37_9DINO|nr:unnamed protein product [Polarella glacialis]